MSHCDFRCWDRPRTTDTGYWLQLPRILRFGLLKSGKSKPSTTCWICSTLMLHRNVLLWFQVLGQTQDHRHRVLVAAAKNIKVWFIKVRKIKAIYYMLNMFNLDVTQKCLIAECWCPVGDLDRIQQALQRGNVRFLNSLHAIGPVKQNMLA